MSSHTTGTEDRTNYEQTASGETGADRSLRDRARRAADAATEHDALGTAAMLGGGTLLASALRSRSGQHRVARGIAGVGLLGVGLAQRLAPGAVPSRDELPVVGDSGADENPRGTGDEPPVDVKTSPDEGPIQFTEHHEEEPRHKPGMDDGPHDPRIDDEGGAVTVDLSTSAMADEESEATGPTPEQAMPTQTDPTEPDRTPTEDASHLAVDTPAPDDWSGNAPDDSLAEDAAAELVDEDEIDEETEVENDAGETDAGETDVGESSDDEHDVVESVVADDEEAEEIREAGEEAEDEDDREDAFQAGGVVHPDDAESMEDDAEEQSTAGDDFAGTEIHPDDAESVDAETGEHQGADDEDVEDGDATAEDETVEGEPMEDYEATDGDATDEEAMDEDARDDDATDE